jgi:hypothetical protein
MPNYVPSNTEWIDYVFYGAEEDKVYRVLVSSGSYNPETDVTVIAENKLSLSGAMGNDYQNASISFTFQAYAIGAGSFVFTNETTNEEKCDEIVAAIYETHKTFLNINVNQ